MAEPPMKRARRVGSSETWETNDPKARSIESSSDNDRRRSPTPRIDRRDGAREDHRYRSRSRDRKDRRRERSWSRDRRDNDRDQKDRDRDLRVARNRKRSTSRDRGYGRRRYASKGRYRSRSRSRSLAGNGSKARSRSRSPHPRSYKGERRPDRRDIRSREDARFSTGASSFGRHKEEMDIDFKEDADEDEMELMMRRSMGFTKFRTTKNTKVPGNDIYGVRKEKKTEYRQYMNRAGGFNRPLSPSR